MLHISDVKKYKRCPRLYYLSVDHPSVYQPYLRHDEELTKLVVEFLGLKDYYLGERGDDPSRVLEALDKHEWFVKARFAYEDLRIKIPVLHRVADGFDLYFAMYAPLPKAEDVEFYRDNIWVLKKVGIELQNIYVIHLSGDYVRQEALDLDKLFVIDRYLYKVKKPSIMLDDLKDQDYDLKTTLDQMRSHTLKDHQPVKRRSCKARGLCDFFDQCFIEDLVDDDIEYLVSSSKKNEMKDRGIKHLKDADLDLIEGTRVQYAQIMASKNGGLYYDEIALKKWLEKFKNKTLCFIDFEWETYMIPPYRGLRPYDHVCFEYSLHMLKKDGSLTHREFIQTGDCREDFIRSLIKDIPKDACLVAYNAEGAEILRLKELKDQFPSYAVMLDDMIARFVDMAYPFSEGLVYHTKMRANFSVKSLVKVVSDLDYRDLDISNGMDAVYKWRLLDKNIQDENLDDVRSELSRYCSLDSYSLYLLYRWLCNITRHIF